MNFLLDTNLVLTYIRNSPQARNLEEDLQLLSGGHTLIISVVTMGELLSIAKQANWGQRKLQLMEDILSDFLIADIHAEDIIEQYATIDAYSQGKLYDHPSSFSARNMGKNDLWIAATASILKVPLYSTDQDFAHLHDKFLEFRLIDLANY